MVTYNAQRMLHRKQDPQDMETIQDYRHTLADQKRYLPASLVAPLPNSEQINIPSSNHIYTKSMPNHTHHHYAPSVTLTHTTHIISSNAATYAPHCHPWICGQNPHSGDGCELASTLCSWRGGYVGELGLVTVTMEKVYHGGQYWYYL